MEIYYLLFSFRIFAFYSYFSGFLFYDSFMNTIYNILFIPWPIEWYVTYDRETSFEKMLKNNMLYKMEWKIYFSM